MKRKNLIQVLLFFALVFCSMQISYSQSISVNIPGVEVYEGEHSYGYSANSPYPDSLYVILRLNDRGIGGFPEPTCSIADYFYPGTYTVYAEFNYCGNIIWDEKSFTVFAYPSVSINGTIPLPHGGNPTPFTASVTGGKQPYSYQWYYKDEDKPNWAPYGNGQTVYVSWVVLQGASFELRVVVTDANNVQCESSVSGY
jgi:hypothetical protein